MTTYSYADIKKSVNRLDSWWSRLVLRHPGSWVLYLIANYTRLTPNALSFISFVFCVLTAMMFGWNHPVFAAVFFQFSLIFDFIDGRLARLTKKSSHFGEFLDNFFDQLKAGLLTAALFAYYWVYFNKDVGLFFFLLFVGYLFLQELSVILWLFAEKNMTAKNEAHIVFTSLGNSSRLMRFINKIKATFDSIGLRLLWSNIETNVIVFSLLPLVPQAGLYIMVVSDLLLIGYLIPEAYIVFNVVLNNDKRQSAGNT